MLRRTTLLILIVFIFSLLTYFVIFEDADKERNRIIQSNLIHTQEIAQDIDQFLETRFLLMEIMVGFLNGHGKINDNVLEEHISPVLKQGYNISSLIVVNTEGEVLFEAHKNLAEEKSSILFSNYLLPYLQYPLQGERFVSNLIRSDLIGEEFIALGLPFVQDGQIKGAVFLTLKTEAFAQLLRDAKVGESGYVSLRDSLGNTIYHPKLAEMRKQNYKLLDIPLIPKSGYKIIVSSFDNHEKYMTYRPLQNANWMVFILQPVSEYKTPIYTIWLKNGSLLILLFIFMYLLYSLENKEKGLLQSKLSNERLEVVAELAAGLAHEIKNPLVPIKGFIQLEKRKPYSTLGQENVRLLLNEIGRIEKIINDFMSLARNNLHEFTETQLLPLLNDTISLMRVEATKKQIKLESNIDSFVEEVMVLGDNNQLTQVFLNVLKNAVEASGAGEIIQVEIKRMINNEVQILIIDRGNGIPPKVLKKIGTPFFSAKEGGTGMGLFVTQRVLANHGGRMEIQSQEGKGTIVTIYLPLI